MIFLRKRKITSDDLSIRSERLSFLSLFLMSCALVLSFANPIGPAIGFAALALSKVVAITLGALGIGSTLGSIFARFKSNKLRKNEQKVQDVAKVAEAKNEALVQADNAKKAEAEKEDQNLIKNRHTSPQDQRAYDKKYGVTLRDPSTWALVATSQPGSPSNGRSSAASIQGPARLAIEGSPASATASSAADTIFASPKLYVGVIAVSAAGVLLFSPTLRTAASERLSSAAKLASDTVRSNCSLL